MHSTTTERSTFKQCAVLFSLSRPAKREKSTLILWKKRKSRTESRYKEEDYERERERVYFEFVIRIEAHCDVSSPSPGKDAAVLSLGSQSWMGSKIS